MAYFKLLHLFKFVLYPCLLNERTHQTVTLYVHFLKFCEFKT